MQTSSENGRATLDAVANYYGEKLAQFGATPRGVDWKDADGQVRRNRQFLRLLEADPTASVCDIGCGYGQFLSFIRAAGHLGVYTGYDVSPAMIDAARSLHGEGSNHRFLIGNGSEGVADYAIGSGLLNVRCGVPPERWAVHVASTIEMLNAAGRRGFGFNVLSLSSDPDKRRSDLYYADPAAMLADCIARYGRHVALLQDYGLWEFTMLVHRQR